MSQISTSEGEAEAGKVDEDWQVIEACAWWRTPFTSVSWTYPEGQHTNPSVSLCLLPSPSSGQGLAREWISGEVADLSLNPELVGVRGAEAVISPYERDVGFIYSHFPTIGPKDLGLLPPLNTSSDEAEVVRVNAERWAELVKDLVSHVPETALSDGEGSLSSSFTDSTGSDFSTMPATPVSKASYANVLLKNVSPSSSISSITEDQPTSLTKTLNVFASSFVPSGSPPPHIEGFSFPSISESLAANTRDRNRAMTSSPLPNLSSFTFPTLNPPTKTTARLTTVKIKKDDQGFFTDVQLDNSGNIDAPSKGNDQPSLLLPSFLQESTPRRRSRASRTREIVDRLRSTQSHATSEEDPEPTNPGLDFNFDLSSKCASHSPSPISHDLSFMQPRLSVSEDGGDREQHSGFSTPSLEDEDEGWIDVAQVKMGPSSASTMPKTKRARDLFLAFTRRRTDSTSSESLKDERASSPSKCEDPKTLAALSSEKAQTKSATLGSSSTASSGFSAAPNNDGWIEGIASPSFTGDLRNSVPLAKQSSPNGDQPKTHRKRQSRKVANQPAFAPISPTHPAFPTISPTSYMNMPLLGPTHLSMMPAAAPPLPFFFNPTTAAYHPATVNMAIPYATAGYMPTSPFGHVPHAMSTHPFISPLAGSKGGMVVGQHQHRNFSSSSTFGNLVKTT